MKTAAAPGEEAAVEKEGEKRGVWTGTAVNGDGIDGSEATEGEAAANGSGVTAAVVHEEEGGGERRRQGERREMKRERERERGAENGAKSEGRRDRRGASVGEEDAVEETGNEGAGGRGGRDGSGSAWKQRKKKIEMGGSKDLATLLPQATTAAAEEEEEERREADGEEVDGAGADGEQKKKREKKESRRLGSRTVATVLGEEKATDAGAWEEKTEDSCDDGGCRGGGDGARTEDGGRKEKAAVGDGNGRRRGRQEAPVVGEIKKKKGKRFHIYIYILEKFPEHRISHTVIQIRRLSLFFFFAGRT